MKATIVLGALLGLALVALAIEPQALAAGIAASQHAAANQDPAWMLLSGATLIATANLVRRYVP